MLRFSLIPATKFQVRKKNVNKERKKRSEKTAKKTSMNPVVKRAQNLVKIISLISYFFSLILYFMYLFMIFDALSTSRCWLRPHIMVRMVSKSFENGKYYNKKVRVLDVTGHNECTIQLESGKLVEGILFF